MTGTLLWHPLLQLVCQEFLDTFGYSVQCHSFFPILWMELMENRHEEHIQGTVTEVSFLLFCLFAGLFLIILNYILSNFKQHFRICLF